MINSTSSSDRTARTDAIAPVTPKPAVRGPGTDNFSASHSAALQAALKAHPEIRPEVVEHGKALAADPSYPSVGILRQVAGALLNSPDPSEDLS